MSSTCSAGVNFTVSQFLARIKKLSMLQHIKNNASQNNLRFPQHHKLSTASWNEAPNLNTALVSKNNIEIRVLDAYQYVINLLSPLKINQCLRNQQKISIEELSSAIAHHLGQSWAKEIDENINEDSDVESDNETDNKMTNDLASNCDSDEDLEFDGGFDVINNVTTSANRGVRLVDNVKEKLSQTYFQVTINKQNKFLHKQTACWLLEKDKSSLPADRLSRVQEQ
ncbi:unnamed protein product [Rotaria sp. Silwood2]|nr:unnamed protein product [Rotaria sp. Silwood2]CAF3042504.1 unnamed protein product [Rotaria sp. Silwood2]CAF3320881.1 unnamed protein product [Rotaria sp. Silwood2]CAF4291788.1 unnamed protein product [Rotaria sp. Silwood2]CAF4314874.1 unnamed protein product [Rotaria sp. Silwood2]